VTRDVELIIVWILFLAASAIGYALLWAYRRTWRLFEESRRASGETIRKQEAEIEQLRALVEGRDGAARQKH
jgi:hypothetical protein